ncbi:MAG TPA: hypothetical protein DCR12_02980 [Lachnospiraceae bacterium]|nr:hypothetical protein [Lachnospiraceae bacterium]
MDRLRNRPLSEILRTEDIYNLFYEEFSKEEWLDVTVLLHSDCSASDILEDGTVPGEVMERVANRLDELDKENNLEPLRQAIKETE